MKLPGRLRQKKHWSSPQKREQAHQGARAHDLIDPVALLAWYDKHRRDLPWRAAPGETPDPYRVWLSEIMLQQTSVKTVAPYYARFLTCWPTIDALARASLGEVLKVWAGLGYYARARNLHACARALVKDYNGRFPDEEARLTLLPGIGPYTAAAIAAIAFARPSTPIDGNVQRVIARLFAIENALPAARRSIRKLAAGLRSRERPGDFAQAMMDLGSTICTPARPACGLCPWQGACAACGRGDPETFPRKAPRIERPLRRGAAFFVRRADAAVLVRSRPPRGLLGGMVEVPTSAWRHDFDEARALEEAPLFSSRGIRSRTLATEATRSPIGCRDSGHLAWQRMPSLVSHAFTHFRLELAVYTAEVAAGTPAPVGMRFVRLAQLEGEALPKVMRKVVALATKQPLTTTWNFR
jgi:A/G-specific adenine glycosylase